MTKSYCDRCGVEADPQNLFRLGDFDPAWIGNPHVSVDRVTDWARGRFVIEVCTTCRSQIMRFAREPGPVYP
jgi:hypothetical protein